MENTDSRVIFDKIKECIVNNHKELDIKRIEDAYILAQESHKGQLRKSGEEYIIH